MRRKFCFNQELPLAPSPPLHSPKSSDGKKHYLRANPIPDSRNAAEEEQIGNGTAGKAGGPHLGTVRVF